MAGPITIPTEFPKYGAVYGEEVSNVEADLSGAGLDLKGQVGDDMEIGVFFDYANLTGYVFSAFVVLDPPSAQEGGQLDYRPPGSDRGLDPGAALQRGLDQDRTCG